MQQSVVAAFREESVGRLPLAFMEWYGTIPYHTITTPADGTHVFTLFTYEIIYP